MEVEVHGRSTLRACRGDVRKLGAIQIKESVTSSFWAIKAVIAWKGRSVGTCPDIRKRRSCRRGLASSSYEVSSVPPGYTETTTLNNGGHSLGRASRDLAKPSVVHFPANTP